jgi:competence protein ComEA
MKKAFQSLLPILLAVAVTMAIYTASAAPRGEPVELIPAPTPAPLTVYVAGSVQSPGIYLLAPGSRVAQAVEAAGGLLPEAETRSINLAAPLKDGDKVAIPAAGEVPAASLPNEGGAPAHETGAVININSAGQSELETLPGIGPTRAEQIIAMRDARGGFDTVEEIMGVPGIGPSTFEKLKPWITVD